MSLTNDDKKWIKGAITEGVVEALNEIVLPRFEEHDERFNQIDGRLDVAEGRLEKIDSRLNLIEHEIKKIHTEQAEMRQWMEHIDNRLMGVESDIKEIYDRIVALEKKAPTLTRKEQTELSRKLEAMLDWAKLVSEKTGVALPKL